MKIKIIIKFIAGITISIFTITTIAWSAPACYNVTVSDELGTVTKRYKGQNSDKVIIHVQDAHSSFEAQKNLAKIICELVPQIESAASRQLPAISRIPFIGIEGAIGTYDLKELRDFPLKEAREAVGGKAVKEGKLIAAEYASMLADEDFDLYGVEDKDLFVKNFKAFYQVALKQSDLESEIEKIEGYLDLLKDAVFNEKLKAFDSAASQYERDQSDLFSYLNTLYQSIDAQKIDLFDYIQLMQFREVLVMQQAIDFEQLDKEIEALSTELSQFDDIRQEVTDYYSQYKEKTLTQKTILQYVTAQAAKQQIHLEQYQTILPAQKYWHAYAMTDVSQLLKEILNINQTVREELAENESEELLIKTGHSVVELKQLLALKALKENVETFRSHRADYSLDTIITNLKKVNLNTGLSLEITEPAIDVSSLLDRVDMFYRAADARDKAMFVNLVREMDAKGQNVGVLVAGGYHSAGLEQIIKEQGLSYVSITPNISHMVEDVAYRDRMMGNIAPLNPVFTSPFQMSRFNAVLRSICLPDAVNGVTESILHDVWNYVFKENGELRSPQEIQANRSKISATGAPKLADAIGIIYDEIFNHIESESLLTEPGIQAMRQVELNDLHSSTRQHIASQLSNYLSDDAYHRLQGRQTDEVAQPQPDNKTDIQSTGNVVANKAPLSPRAGRNSDEGDQDQALNMTIPGPRGVVRAGIWAGYIFGVALVVSGMPFFGALLMSFLPLIGIHEDAHFTAMKEHAGRGEYFRSLLWRFSVNNKTSEGTLVRQTAAAGYRRNLRVTLAALFGASIVALMPGTVFSTIALPVFGGIFLASIVLLLTSFVQDMIILSRATNMNVLRVGRELIASFWHQALTDNLKGVSEDVRANLTNGDLRNLYLPPEKVRSYAMGQRRQPTPEEIWQEVLSSVAQELASLGFDLDELLQLLEMTIEIDADNKYYVTQINPDGEQAEIFNFTSMPSAEDLIILLLTAFIRDDVTERGIYIGQRFVAGMGKYAIRFTVLNSLLTRMSIINEVIQHDKEQGRSILERFNDKKQKRKIMVNRAIDRLLEFRFGDDRYLVTRFLGRGGMAENYLCVNRKTEELVVMKVAASERVTQDVPVFTKSQNMLYREYLIMRGLNKVTFTDRKRPIVPEVYAFKTNAVGERSAFIMEFIDGKPLEDAVYAERQALIDHFAQHTRIGERAEELIQVLTSNGYLDKRGIRQGKFETVTNIHDLNLAGHDGTVNPVFEKERMMIFGELKQWEYDGYQAVIQLLERLIEICDDVSAMHRREFMIPELDKYFFGVLHRDLNPANILISKGRSRLIDVGIARSVGETVTTSVEGRYGYIPPERYEGEDEGRASDVYSLGVILFWLLTDIDLNSLPEVIDSNTRMVLFMNAVSKTLGPETARILGDDFILECAEIIRRATAEKQIPYGMDLKRALASGDFRYHEVDILKEALTDLLEKTKQNLIFLPVLERLAQEGLPVQRFYELDKIWTEDNGFVLSMKHRGGDALVASPPIAVFETRPNMDELIDAVRLGIRFAQAYEVLNIVVQDLNLSHLNIGMHKLTKDNFAITKNGEVIGEFNEGTATDNIKNFLNTSQVILPEERMPRRVTEWRRQPTFKGMIVDMTVVDKLRKYADVIDLMYEMVMDNLRWGGIPDNALWRFAFSIDERTGDLVILFQQEEGNNASLRSVLRYSREQISSMNSRDFYADVLFRLVRKYYTQEEIEADMRAMEEHNRQQAEEHRRQLEMKRNRAKLYIQRGTIDIRVSDRNLLSNETARADVEKLALSIQAVLETEPSELPNLRERLVISYDTAKHQYDVLFDKHIVCSYAQESLQGDNEETIQQTIGSAIKRLNIRLSNERFRYYTRTGMFLDKIIEVIEHNRNVIPDDFLSRIIVSFDEKTAAYSITDINGTVLVSYHENDIRLLNVYAGFTRDVLFSVVRRMYPPGQTAKVPGPASRVEQTMADKDELDSSSLPLAEYNSDAETELQRFVDEINARGTDLNLKNKHVRFHVVSSTHEYVTDGAISFVFDATGDEVYGFCFHDGNSVDVYVPEGMINEYISSQSGGASVFADSELAQRVLKSIVGHEMLDDGKHDQAWQTYKAVFESDMQSTLAFMISRMSEKQQDALLDEYEYYLRNPLSEKRGQWDDFEWELFNTIREARGFTLMSGAEDVIYAYQEKKVAALNNYVNRNNLHDANQARDEAVAVQLLVDERFGPAYIDMAERFAASEASTVEVVIVHQDGTTNKPLNKDAARLALMQDDTIPVHTEASAKIFIGSDIDVVTVVFWELAYVYNALLAESYRNNNSGSVVVNLEGSYGIFDNLEQFLGDAFVQQVVQVMRERAIEIAA